MFFPINLSVDIKPLKEDGLLNSTYFKIRLLPPKEHTSLNISPCRLALYSKFGLVL